MPLVRLRSPGQILKSFADDKPLIRLIGQALPVWDTISHIVVGAFSADRNFALETFYDAEPGLLKQSAIALGFFDGVHPGHQVVIGKAVEEARRIGAKAGV